MRAVVTRVSKASVSVDDVIFGEINEGFLVLLGVGQNDSLEDVKYLAQKIATLRVFQDDKGKMNLDIKTIGGSILAVSQFTLYASTKSRRPSFTGAGAPDLAKQLYEAFIKECCQLDIPVEQGQFGAYMHVSSVNDGPVTILFDTDSK